MATRYREHSVAAMASDAKKQTPSDPNKATTVRIDSAARPFVLEDLASNTSENIPCNDFRRSDNDCLRLEFVCETMSSDKFEQSKSKRVVLFEEPNLAPVAIYRGKTLVALGSLIEAEGRICVRINELVGTERKAAA